MARRPVILVSVAETDRWGEYWARVFTRPLLAAGALPLLVPGFDDATGRRAALERADGLLLGGGWDIAPERYGEIRNELLWELDPRRDELEIGLVLEALALGLPILGTCRGMQVINVALGGTLYLDRSLHPGAEQHLSEGRGGFQDLVDAELAGDGHATTPAKHRIAVVPGTRLHRLFGDEAFVSSFHHQHVRELGAGVVVAATADDGVVEAIEVPGAAAPVLGVQWEVQEGWREDRAQLALFELLAAAGRRSGPPPGTAPRLTPVGEPSDEQRAVLDKTLKGPDGEPLNVFATLARIPRLLRRLNALGGYFFVAGDLPARERELVILRTAGRVASSYEIAQHRWIAVGAGLGAEEIEAAIDGARVHDWSADDGALLRFTDELLDGDTVSNGAWDTVAGRRGVTAATELLVLVGYYRLLAGVLNGLRVPIDDAVLELVTPSAP